MGGPQSLTLSPDGRNAYVLGRLSQPGLGSRDPLFVFEREPETGRLGLLQALNTERDGIVADSEFATVAVSPDGLEVLYARSNGSILVFDRDPANGSLALARVEPSRKEGFVGGPDSIAALFAAKGRSFYVATPSSLSTFRRQLPSGALTLLEDTRRRRPGGSDSVDFLISPNERHAYIASVFEIIIAPVLILSDIETLDREAATAFSRPRIE